MTIARTVEIGCPKCGSRNEATVWNSLNVSLNPEAKQELMTGKLNRFVCGVCGFDAAIAADLLYHDMKREYLVQFHPLSDMDDEGFFGRFTVNGRPEFNMVGLENARPYFSNIHVVFSMDELMRYVIFRDRLYEHNVRTAPSAEQGPGGLS